MKSRTSGRVAVAFWRNLHAERLFHETVVKAFDNRCAVTKKRLNDVQELAHIEEEAFGGCYNANSGILLSPTFHKLVDTYQMGIDPEILKVHFKQGIEYDKHAGRGIVQPLHGLGRELLAVCWQKFLNTKLLNLIF
ncbi:TPA: hypothetical protein MYR49_004694, partial [Escherichia coli]|nr:hypothetical protein [Escherichia coli]